MKRTIILCVLLYGCATATPLNTGNGKQFLIECDGMAVPISTCFKKANAVCPSGWDMISTDGKIIPVGSATPDVAYVGAYQQKSITVQCK
jgi:hypothetical protein